MPIQTISTNDSSIKKMSGVNLKMDSMEISPLIIEEMSFSNFKSIFDYSRGSLKNTKVRFEVKVVLNWEMKYDVKFLDHIIETVNDGSSIELFDFDTGFIDADLVKVDPGKMIIAVPNLKIEKYNQDVIQTDPYSKISADKMQVDKITMDETVITNSTPALFGGTIPVKNPFGAQDMSVNNTNMDSFSAIQIRIPDFYMTNLNMQGVEVESVVSDNFEIKAHCSKQSTKYKLANLVSAWATINIAVTTKADKVEYSDLRGNINADRTLIKWMTMNLKLRNIQIKDLKMDEFDIPEIGIGL